MTNRFENSEPISWKKKILVQKDLKFCKFKRLPQLSVDISKILRNFLNLIYKNYEVLVNFRIFRKTW